MFSACTSAVVSTPSVKSLNAMFSMPSVEGFSGTIPLNPCAASDGPDAAPGLAHGVRVAHVAQVEFVQRRRAECDGVRQARQLRASVGGRVEARHARAARFPWDKDCRANNGRGSSSPSACALPWSSPRAELPCCRLGSRPRFAVSNTAAPALGCGNRGQQIFGRSRPDGLRNLARGKDRAYGSPARHRLPQRRDSCAAQRSRLHAARERNPG